MAPVISKRERLDRDMGGKLESYVRARRAAYRSWTDIAYELRATYGAEITGESLRQWFPETKDEAAS